MDESYKCECGLDDFWFFITHVRCGICYNEYKYDSETGELWMRRFDHEENVYSGSWEHAPR